jgi:uncharacterized protein
MPDRVPTATEWHVASVSGKIPTILGMNFDEFIWPEARIEHIAEHGVTTEEFEEACSEGSLFVRAPSEGENPVYYVLGQTAAGRYLFCMVIRFPDGNGYPISARPMTAKEKRRFRTWKDQ